MLRRAHQSVGQPLSMFRIVLIHDEPSRVRFHYHQHLSYVLGGSQMLMGILCIVTVIAIIDQRVQCVEGFLAVAGIPFFVTGVLCVAAARHRKSCSIMCMVLLAMLSILSAITVIIGACQNISSQCQMNIVLIIVVVIDGFVASASIWIGGLSMSGKPQPSLSAAMVTHPASEGTATHLTGDVHAVLPPCQMSSPTMPGHQPTVTAYSDISPGFQSQHIEKPESVISPTLPRYTSLSEPPPAYTETVVTAPSSGQSV